MPPLPPQLALVCLVGLAGCISAPETEEWLAVGYRSPEQTFRTFQTALAAGDALDLEYRCLAAELLADEGITQVGYRVMREELMEEQPYLRHAADAKILGIEELSPGRVRLTARVKKLFQEVTFEVVLVEESYWELWDGERNLDGDVLDGDPGERPDDGALRPSADGSYLYGAAPLRGGLDPSAITELRLGREWKIASFGLPGAPGAAGAQP